MCTLCKCQSAQLFCFHQDGFKTDISLGWTHVIENSIIYKAGMLRVAMIDLQLVVRSSSSRPEFSRKCTPLRKRTNKDNFRCLVTILSSGVARRRLNEHIFVKTSNSSKTDIFHFFSL